MINLAQTVITCQLGQSLRGLMENWLTFSLWFLINFVSNRVNTLIVYEDLALVNILLKRINYHALIAQKPFYWARKNFSLAVHESYFLSLVSNSDIGKVNLHKKTKGFQGLYFFISYHCNLLNIKNVINQIDDIFWNSREGRLMFLYHGLHVGIGIQVLN